MGCEYLDWLFLSLRGFDTQGSWFRTLPCSPGKHTRVECMPELANISFKKYLSEPKLRTRKRKKKRKRKDEDQCYYLRRFIGFWRTFSPGINRCFKPNSQRCFFVPSCSGVRTVVFKGTKVSREKQAPALYFSPAYLALDVITGAECRWPATQTHHGRLTHEKQESCWWEPSGIRSISPSQ